VVTTLQGFVARDSTPTVSFEASGGNEGSAMGSLFAAAQRGDWSTAGRRKRNDRWLRARARMPWAPGTRSWPGSGGPADGRSRAYRGWP